jgi:ACS family sodium-dependent inorganic phosphate cotransporter
MNLPAATLDPEQQNNPTISNTTPKQKYDPPHSPSTPPQQPPKWQYIVGLSAIAILICYADRSNISTSIIPMSDQYQWDARYQGIILSAFFAGYFFTQLLGGALSDEYGGKGVLTAGVAIWSATTFLTPASAELGFVALIFMRIAMGLGEGVAFPAIHSVIGRSVPREKQSTAVALVTASSYAGTALAFAVAPFVIETIGWPWVFYMFGASATLWLPFWTPLTISSNEGSTIDVGFGGSSSWKRVASQEEIDGDDEFSMSNNNNMSRRGGSSIVELKTIEPANTTASPPFDNNNNTTTNEASNSNSNAGDGWRYSAVDPNLPSSSSTTTHNNNQTDRGFDIVYVLTQLFGNNSDTTTNNDSNVGFQALIRTKPVWAICVAQYTGSWGFYGLLTWLPSFFKDHYAVEISQLPALTFWPYAVQGGIGVASGILADGLLNKAGWSVKRVRRVLQTTGMVGPAICMVAAASPLTDGSPAGASAWVTLGLGMSALTLAGVSVNHLDIAPGHAGVVFAVGNTCATLAGLLAVPLTGVLLDLTGSWSLVFGIAAAHYLVGAVVFYVWVGGERLEEDGR